MNTDISHGPGANDKKIWFAHALRGIAALMVCYRHLFEAFFNSTEFNQQLIKDPNFVMPPGVAQNIFFRLSIFNYESLGLNFGILGVAIFFLISGFVIPISIENKDFKTFIVNRIIRIFPTCIAGITIGCIAVYMHSLFIPNALPFFTLNQYLANIMIVPRPILGVEFIDAVTWTLEVELLFYVLLATVAKISSITSARSLLLLASALTTVFLVTKLWTIPTELKIVNHCIETVQRSAHAIIFMLIGVSFYNLFRRYWMPRKTFVVICILLGLIAVHLAATGFQEFRLWSFSYVYALAIFGLAYLYRNELWRNKILNFFADISYSLYMNHQVLGYVLIATFIPVVRSNYGAGVVALIIVVAISYLVHRLVEKPTMLLGKKYASRIDFSFLKIYKI